MRHFMSRLPSDESVAQEDYFFRKGEMTSNDRKVYALIIYDIIDNKKRTKFAKYMKGYGERVQKSCFEVIISQKKFEKMLNCIGKYCGEVDSIRVYRIHGKSQVYQWGRTTAVEEEDVIIL